MKRKIAGFILLLTGIVYCFGQEVFTLEDVRTLSLSSSLSLARLNLSAESTQRDDKSRQFDMLPSLSLGASASASLWGGSGLAQSLGAGANLSLNQKLWDGGKNSVQKAINQLSTEAARLDALAEYYAVLDSADAAYYGVLEAQASLKAAETSLESAALSLSMAEVRLGGGMISYGDYLQALAEHETQKTSHNLAKRDLSLALAKLKNITGLAGLAGEISLQEVDFESYEPLIQFLAGVTDEDIAGLYGAFWGPVDGNNPSLVKAALNSQKAGHSVSLAMRSYFPSFSAGVSAGVNYGRQTGFEITGGKLTLSASIPLEFWVTGNDVEIKKIAREQTNLDYQSASNNLNIEMQTSILDCIAQANSVISSRRAFEYSQRHFDSVMELFRLSQASVSDLSAATALVSSNQKQLIKAQYDFLSGLSAIRSLGAFESEEQVTALLYSRGLP